MGIGNIGKSLPPPSDPDAALGAVVALRGLADRLEAEAVQEAINRGWTWQEIAQSLGVSKQAAHKKHARTISTRKDQR